MIICVITSLSIILALPLNSANHDDQWDHGNTGHPPSNYSKPKDTVYYRQRTAPILNVCPEWNMARFKNFSRVASYSVSLDLDLTDTEIGADEWSRLP